MNDKMKELFESVKSSVKSVACATGKAAQSASKKAGEFVENTKLNLKLFDLNTDIETEYKEIGKLVYKTHLGEDISQEELEEHLAAADKKNDEINEIKERLGTDKPSADTVKCNNCGKECSCECTFCPNCGSKLQPCRCQHSVVVEPVTVKPQEDSDSIYENDDESSEN